MGNENSVLNTIFDITQNAERTFVQPKDSTTRRRLANIRMIQNVVLIWLDNHIDNNDIDCRNTITQLRRVVNTIKMFTDGDQCVQFISTVKDEKIYMIVSGSLGQHVVPRIHDISQVNSIFIFCGNKIQHEQWAKDWFKVKGVFTEITPIGEALKQVAHEYEHNAISISFINIDNDDVRTKKLDQLDGSFMYTQILKEILLTIEFEEKHTKEFFDYCLHVFADNEVELTNIKQLKREYPHKTPIWWYTSESFLYLMLNRALQIMDIDTIMKMGFFIKDLQRHLQKLHLEQVNRNQISNTFTIYRGQGISKTDFEEMAKINVELVSFNNYLSATKDRTTSLEFARKAIANYDLMGILFVMTIDPSKSTKPFAFINNVIHVQGADEVLFSMPTVFRIKGIKPMIENERLFQVDLTLTSDNDKYLCALSDKIREETEGSTGWNRLSKLLLKWKTNEMEKGDIYHQIGWIKHNQGRYKEAIEFYEKSLEIYQKSPPSTNENLANCYNDIGNTFFQMGEYSKALSFHEKVLEIRQKTLPLNHHNLAASYNNIGAVYNSMGDHSKALMYYNKDLEISQKILPANHPDLASCYNNIGIAYHNMDEYPKALSYYTKALEIREQLFSSNHPALAKSYHNIGAVYDNMGEYSKALSYYEKDLEINHKILPSTHPDLAMSYNNIGIVYHNMDEFAKALSYYEKALEIQQKSLSSYHPSLAMSYNNIGAVYKDTNEYSKALPNCERAVDIGQRSLPSNHPHLQLYKNNLDSVKQKL